jgi:hypothetical protein
VATILGRIEDELQTRLRIGTAETAISDTNVFDVVDKVQKTINYALRRKIGTGTLTLATGSFTLRNLFDATASIASDCLRVLSLYDSSRTVMRIPDWNQFQQHNRNWYNSSGARVEAWTPIGLNYIALYPSVPSTTTANTLTAVYIADTTTLNSSGDAINLSDHDLALLYDLAEIVLLAHLRLTPELSRKVNKLEADIIPYIEGDEWV